MKNAMRWVLVVPSAIAVWVAVFFPLAVYYDRITSACLSATLPKCQDPTYLFQANYLPSIGAALSAVFVVITVYWVAPTHKQRSAWVSFAIGSIVAIVLAFNHSRLEAACAIAAGLITAVAISRRTKPTA